MPSRIRNENVNRSVWSMLVALAIVLPAIPAQAQVVQNCQPDQYLDRTAPGADRQLTWDFGIASDPERCLQVRAGQTVVWNGDLDTHPLAAQGGDTPNPIAVHQNGSVTFNAAGTFGFICSSHSPMKGAIKVVAAAPASVPGLSPQFAALLTIVLLASGSLFIRKQRIRRAVRPAI